MSQLEFYKTVLEKVSFNKTLFLKELAKAKNDLSLNDQQELERWFEGHLKFIQ